MNRHSRGRSQRPLAGLLVVVSVVGTTLAALASDTGAAPRRARVQPFEKVQASDIVFERDSSDPDRGVFRVTTTEPMICAIVWGADEKFGRFNNSLAMNGTGIVEHDVFLPDVDGGVTYFYLVQGTTADGTLYRSEVGTFELTRRGDGSASPAVDARPNLALNATVTEVSSEFSASFAAAHAIDGDTATEWSTRGDGNKGFITLDLGATSAIAAVEFVTRSMPDGSAITKTFTATVDGGRPLGRFRAGTLAKPRPADIGVSGRIVRFDVASSTGGNVGAMEIRVYGA